MISIIEKAHQFNPRTALADERGEHSYGQLILAAEAVATGLLHGREELEEARVALLVPPGFDYVATLWGIWMAGGVAVPLCVSHPLPELEYVLSDTEAEALLVHPDLIGRAPPAGARTVTTDELLETDRSTFTPPRISAQRRALILYTSGTTRKPKDVVTTHGNLTSQMETLVDAWEWSCQDRILHILPLHHTHGIVNALLCPLWSGAVCEFLTPFRAGAVWERFAGGGISLFMAVPTIYSRLIACWEEAGPANRERFSNACRGLRLMVSGSAALPVPVFERWKAIAGHTLLERYGMTEIGMALSNPLHGARRPGSVGVPLPGVRLRLVEDSGDPIGPGAPGEIEVQGAAVFSEYWRRPQETEAAFRDGWFRTGDVAVIEDGYYRILGRQSVDIIKSGGYKISALEIEDVLRRHPRIGECAVVGVPDPEWGERVCAAVIPEEGGLTLETLRDWAKERMAVYKIPSRMLLLERLPCNSMGKVTKPQIRHLFRES